MLLLGLGSVVTDFKQAGTEACARDRLNMSASTSACSDWHILSARPGTLPGPAAFRGFVLPSHGVDLVCSPCLTSICVDQDLKSGSRTHSAHLAVWFGSPLLC